MNRRDVLTALLGTVPALTVGCARPTPKTPLAHLYGREWVRGAYELYAGRYLDIQRRTDTGAISAYRVLGATGVPTLGNLQRRGVPFYIKARPRELRFAVERNIPERLTFTADMTDAQRQRATEAWNQARKYIQLDYQDVTTVDQALSGMFGQMVKVRTTIDHTQDERFQLADQIGALAEGPPPFELPYQVSKSDYRNVLFLLLDRLRTDQHRLEGTETAMISVGLTSRATDAGSGSLASNMFKVLLAAKNDHDASPANPAQFPETRQQFTQAVARGQKAYQAILDDPAYIALQKKRRAAAWRQIGALFSILDSITGLPTSTIFNTAVTILSGDRDYLTYLEAAANLAPNGSKLARLLHDAADTTRTVRARLRQVHDIAEAVRDRGVVNVGSEFAQERLERQVVFYRNEAEQRVTLGNLKATGWL